MPAIYFEDIQLVSCFYKFGRIKTSSGLQHLLPPATCAALPRPPSALSRLDHLTWLFDDRSAELNALVSRNNMPFLGLYSYYDVSFTQPADSFILVGQSGSGNLNTLDSYNAVDNRDSPSTPVFPVSEWPDPGDIGRQAPAIPGLQPVLLSFAPLGPSHPLSVDNHPRIVHITSPEAILPRLYTDSNSRDANQFITYLSDLPADKINPHGRLSTGALHLALQTDYPVSYVSSEYPVLSSADPIRAGLSRPDMAFSSPLVLGLQPGDILFINQDFKTGSHIHVPVLFDLAVYKITEWLEAKGVIVLFSAGGSDGGFNINLSEPIDENEYEYRIDDYLPSTRPLPGLIIGGLKLDKSDFTSNYGSLVHCFGTPVTFIDGTVFGASSGATAYVSGLILAGQLQAKKQHKDPLTAIEVRQLFAGMPKSAIQGESVCMAPQLPDFIQRVDRILQSRRTIRPMPNSGIRP